MNTRTRHLVAAVAAVFASIALAPALAQAPAAPSKAAEGAKPAAKAVQTAFASAEEAVKALVTAVRASDAKAVAALMGKGAEEWLFTGDNVSDREEWTRFLTSFDKKNGLEKSGDAKATLVVGDDAWPFPAPLVKKGDKWSFDGAAGREEVTNRRVGRNELDTIQTLLAVVDAQREYASTDADKNGFNDYARHFISREGKRDGLYWPVKAGEPQSPLGPLIGQASNQGYGQAKQGQSAPFNGYHYKLLTAQGKEARGGAYSYLVNDKLIGGFAVAAWPAKYGVSGVMTFVVNHDGVVYEKDLGSGTASAVAKMTLFNPDKTWKKAH